MTRFEFFKNLYQVCPMMDEEEPYSQVATPVEVCLASSGCICVAQNCPITDAAIAYTKYIRSNKIELAQWEGGMTTDVFYNTLLNCCPHSINQGNLGVICNLIGDCDCSDELCPVIESLGRYVIQLRRDQKIRAMINQQKEVPDEDGWIRIMSDKTFDELKDTSGVVITSKTVFDGGGLKKLAYFYKKK